ncbi:unnamed protein product [Ectocarpus sp. 8 AP-2014]
MKWSSVGLMAVETILLVCPVKNRRKRLSYSDKYRTAWSTPSASELTSTVFAPVAFAVFFVLRKHVGKSIQSMKLG